MLVTKSKATDLVSSDLIQSGNSGESARAGGIFTVKCFDQDGNLKWEESAHNLVVNEGLQDMNTEYFKGVTYTAAWYLGLVTGPGAGNTYAAADTLASHAGWTEDTAYSGSRQAVTFGTATTADPSVINNSGSPSVFNITGTTTIAGAFLTNVNTGTSGVLFSVANFQAPGDRSVVSGDTLSVTYTFNLDAA